jgi:hypothetical protein
MEREDEEVEVGRDESPPDDERREPESDPTELTEQHRRVLSKIPDRDARWAVEAMLKRAIRAMKSDMKYRKRTHAAEQDAAAKAARLEEVEARLAAVEAEGGDTAAAARHEIDARFWRYLATEGDVLPERKAAAFEFLRGLDDFALVAGEVVGGDAQPVRDEDFAEALKERPEWLRARGGPGSGGNTPNAFRDGGGDIIGKAMASQTFYEKNRQAVLEAMRRRGGSR